MNKIRQHFNRPDIFVFNIFRNAEYVQLETVEICNEKLKKI